MGVIILPPPYHPKGAQPSGRVEPDRRVPLVVPHSRAQEKPEAPERWIGPDARSETVGQQEIEDPLQVPVTVWPRRIVFHLDTHLHQFFFHVNNRQWNTVQVVIKASHDCITQLLIELLGR
jgi:hypothetical protein